MRRVHRTGGQKKYNGFNMEEYEEIEQRADSLIETFKEVSPKTNIIQRTKRLCYRMTSTHKPKMQLIEKMGRTYKSIRYK